jgi:hypothetical protein
MSRHPAVRSAVEAMAQERLAMNRAAATGAEHVDHTVDHTAPATDK